MDNNRLADRYVIAAYSLPEELRMRRPMEEALAERFASGKNICIRGFWRIGKTELMKATVGNACRRSGANGFFYDMRSNDNGGATPKSKEEVLLKMGQMVKEFCAQAAPGLEVSADDPLRSLGRIGGPIFVGIDEMIALGSIGEDGMKEVIDYMKSAPPNVRFAVVCHRNRSVDGPFRSMIDEDPSFLTAFVPTLSDEEHAFIVGTPASQLGVTISDGAMARLAAASGNKPWEAFIFSHIVAEALERVGGCRIDEDMVDEFLTLDALIADYHGREVVENYGRMLLFAMTEDEKAVMTGIANAEASPLSGKEAAAAALAQAGWVSTEPVPMINGRMFGEFIRAISSGKLNISTG